MSRATAGDQMQIPLSKVASCPYLVDFNNEKQHQPKTSVDKKPQMTAEAKVDLSSALKQFIQEKRWKDYEHTCASPTGAPLA